jgi:sortase A
VVLLDLRNGTWDIEQLTQEVGHLRGTASPGDRSNMALAGHVTLSQGGDGPFRDLAQIRSGQEAIVYAGDEAYTYVIDSVKVVDPTDVTVTSPTDQSILTLITCANWDSGLHLYTDRIVAIGHLAQP